MSGRVRQSVQSTPVGRDGLQDKLIALTGIGIVPGDRDAINQRKVDILTLVNAADGNSAALLQLRLQTEKDPLNRYLGARLSTGLLGRIRRDLAKSIAATRGLGPQGSSAGRSVSRGTGTSSVQQTKGVARKVIALLDLPIIAGSGSRHARLYRYFTGLPFMQGARLRTKLVAPDDPLMHRMEARLGRSTARALVAEALPDWNADWLPENLDDDLLLKGMQRANVTVPGSDDNTEVTQEYRRALFDEAARRSIAHTAASDQRLSDIALEAKYPALELAQLRAIQAVARENMRWMDARGEVHYKLAISYFISTTKKLDKIAPNAGRLHAYGIWASMMKVQNPKRMGDYLDGLTRDMGSVGQIFEDAYRDKLHHLNYRWIYAVSTPSFLAFVGELHDSGELFELSNFKAAAQGIGDGLVMAAQGIIDTLNPYTWAQAYRDFRDHAGYIFQAFDQDSIDAVRADLKVKFNAFSMLSSEEQARATSAVLTAAVVSPVAEVKLVQAGISVGKKVATKLKKPDPAIPEARVVNSKGNKTPKPIRRARYLQSKFRKEMLKVIMKDKNHELRFLLNEAGDGWYRPPSNKHIDLHDADPSDVGMVPIDAGHKASKKLLGADDIQRVMVQDRHINRATPSRVVEIPGMPAGFLDRPCIEIGGVPVDTQSAMHWVTLKKDKKGNPLLSLETVLNAPAHPGWNNGV